LKANDDHHALHISSKSLNDDGDVMIHSTQHQLTTKSKFSGLGLAMQQAADDATLRFENTLLDQNTRRQIYAMHPNKQLLLHISVHHGRVLRKSQGD
jgi:hypothetical protein